ncbi:MAG: TetR/AcrR family transcriptional regulator [Polyangiaceae bacterium]|nr:TetR/AcrR family transcriptional regulator [Polyangiaceae bacterium]
MHPKPSPSASPARATARAGGRARSGARGSASGSGRRARGTAGASLAIPPAAPSQPQAFEPGRLPSQRPGKAGGVRAKNREERTRVLCQAALRLFLTHGVEAATVDEITREADVAKGSFYRYFDDKEQLVDALFAPLRTSVVGAIRRCEAALANETRPETLATTYQVLATELAGALLGSLDLVRLYLQECRGPAEGARRPIRVLSEDLAEGAFALTYAAHAHGLLRPLPPKLTALAVVGAVEALLMGFLEQRDLGSLPEVPGALISMLLDGLRRR